MLDAIVISAGHAGLNISHYLKELRMEHIVLERKTIGDSWISQRWDSFTLNTPDWALTSAIFHRQFDVFVTR